MRSGSLLSSLILSYAGRSASWPRRTRIGTPGTTTIYLQRFAIDLHVFDDEKAKYFTRSLKYLLEKKKIS